MKNTVDKSSILQAQERIRSFVSPSPLKKSEFLSQKSKFDCYIKLENLNPTGSFKIRGAANALIKNKEQAIKNGVVAASAGNHAQGVARMAQVIGAKCTIFMPLYTPQIKIRATESYGAKVELIGDQYDTTYAAAKDYCRSNQSLMIHGFADCDVISGQGTIGIDLQNSIANPDLVIIPIGGGGLISGIATYLKEVSPKTKILGVQTTYYPAMRDKFASLSPNTHKKALTIADGIAVKAPGDINYEIVKKYVDEITIVDDDQISTAIFNLMENDHIVAEGAGAAASAVLCFKDAHIFKSLSQNAKIVSIVSGGNIDFNLLQKISAKVMKQLGRLMRIHVAIDDRPGNLAKILQIIASNNVNIVDIVHNRVFTDAHAYNVECTFDLETLHEQQQNSLLKLLEQHQYVVRRDF